MLELTTEALQKRAVVPLQGITAGTLPGEMVVIRLLNDDDVATTIGPCEPEGLLNTIWLILVREPVVKEIHVPVARLLSV